MLDNLASDLQKYLNITLKKEDKENKKKYFLNLKDGTDICLKENELGIYFHAKIAHFEEKKVLNLEEFYTYLMQANYLGKGTGDCTVSLDPSEKFLTLSLLIAYEINYKMFYDLLENFVNYLSFWKKEITLKLDVDK
jgi:hypothetical protein